MPLNHASIPSFSGGICADMLTRALQELSSLRVRELPLVKKTGGLPPTSIEATNASCAGKFFVLADAGNAFGALKVGGVVLGLGSAATSLALSRAKYSHFAALRPPGVDCAAIKLLKTGSALGLLRVGGVILSSENGGTPSLLRAEGCKYGVAPAHSARGPLGLSSGVVKDITLGLLRMVVGMSAFLNGIAFGMLRTGGSGGGGGGVVNSRTLVEWRSNGFKSAVGTSRSEEAERIEDSQSQPS